MVHYSFLAAKNVAATGYLWIKKPIKGWAKSFHGN
jgi:hypothetical protein